MTGLMHPHFPVILVDDEVQALNSFELTFRSANLNHFIRPTVSPSKSGAPFVAVSALVDNT